MQGVLVKPNHYQTAGVKLIDMVPKELQDHAAVTTNEEGWASLVAAQAGPLSSIELESRDYGRQTIQVDRRKVYRIERFAFDQPHRFEVGLRERTLNGLVACVSCSPQCMTAIEKPLWELRMW